MNLSIALYVVFREPHLLTNRVFGFFGVMVALWTLAIGLAYNPPTTGLFLVRSTFSTASLMLVGLVTLFLVFPSDRHLPRARIYVALTACGLLFTAVAATPLLVHDATYDPSTGITLRYGHLHRVFALYVYGSLGYCLYSLITKLWSATGFAKLQLRYLLLGVLLPGAAVTVTNLLIPLLTSISTFGRYGPAFTLVFLSLTAHALIRHRLMNIRLVISRTVASLLAVLFSLAAFLGLFGVASLPFTQRPHSVPLWLELLLIFPIALLFPPIRSFFQWSLDRYLYRAPYDYDQTVRDASRQLGTMLDLPSLLGFVCQVLGQTIRPEHISVFMKHSDSGEYRCVAHHRVVGQDELGTLSSDSLLVAFLTDRSEPSLKDDLLRSAPGAVSEQVLDEFRRLQAECILPLYEDRNLSGFLVLGPKLSVDPYFQEDLDLLTTLAGQATSAIKNAQLYRQVVFVNEYVENVLSTMESGVIAVSAEGTITLFNPAAERLTGLLGHLAKGCELSALPLAISTPLRASLSDRRPRSDLETIIQHTDGRLIPVICSTAILTDRKDSRLGAIAVLSDLTKLKQLEAEKRQVERLASIGAIASNFAHEIKNPLVAIKTFAELLPERFNDEDFRNDFSKVVIREIERIDDLVARLRDLAAPRQHELQPLNLRGPIEETLSLLRGQLELSRITARVACEAGQPVINGDSAQLKQLFLNVFMNAVESMETDGQLNIRIYSREALGHQTLVVEVQDSGAGIPERLLGSIFDPFVTTKRRGSGLGLSICRGIADMHRASIKAENNGAGAGATISIEFPTSPELQPAAPST